MERRNSLLAHPARQHAGCKSCIPFPLSSSVFEAPSKQSARAFNFPGKLAMPTAMPKIQSPERRCKTEAPRASVPCQGHNAETKSVPNSVTKTYFAVDPENVFAGVIYKQQHATSSTTTHFVPLASPSRKDEEWVFEKCPECEAAKAARAAPTRRRGSVCAFPPTADTINYPISEKLFQRRRSPLSVSAAGDEDELSVRNWDEVRRSSLLSRTESRVGVLFC